MPWSCTAPRTGYSVTVYAVSGRMKQKQNKTRSRGNVYRCTRVMSNANYGQLYTQVCYTVLVDISPATGTETYSPTTMTCRCRPVTRPSSSVCFSRSADAGCAPGWTGLKTRMANQIKHNETKPRTKWIGTTGRKVGDNAKRISAFYLHTGEVSSYAGSMYGMWIAGVGLRRTFRVVMVLYRT